MLFGGLAGEARSRSGQPGCDGDGGIIGAFNLDGSGHAGGGDATFFADAVLLLALRRACFVIDTARDGEELLKGEFSGLGVGDGHGFVCEQWVVVVCDWEVCSSDDLKIAGMGSWGIDGDQGRL